MQLSSFRREIGKVQVLQENFRRFSSEDGYADTKNSEVCIGPVDSAGVLTVPNHGMHFLNLALASLWVEDRVPCSHSAGALMKQSRS